jgi:hypothetical protein
MCFGWRIMKVMLVWGSKIALKSFTIALDCVHRIICRSGLLLVGLPPFTVLVFYVYRWGLGNNN